MHGSIAMQAIVAEALRLSQADETEVILHCQDIALTRFAQNHIHQNVAEVAQSLVVRAVVGQRVGLATTHDLSRAGLAAVTARAVAHARLLPEDPDFPGLPQPRPLPSLTVGYDEGTATWAAPLRAEAVAEVCELAAEAGLQAFGAYQTLGREVAVGNSHGVWAYQPSSLADLQIVVAGEAGSGWAQASGWQQAALPVRALAQEAVNKARRNQHPRPLEGGRYPVVLEPYASADLLEALNYFGLGGGDLLDGHSWMASCLGEQVMSPQISIWDDGLDPRGAPMAFDYEGMPRQRVQLVEAGRVCGPVHDSHSARRAGVESTGHACMPDEGGALARNLFMAEGDLSLDALIRQVPRGLFITRFWYPRLVRLQGCVVSATTRDGVFWIENGQLSHPVKDLRFTQSYLAALANVQGVGREARTIMDSRGYSLCAPALLIDDFAFEGSTS